LLLFQRLVLVRFDPRLLLLFPCGLQHRLLFRSDPRLPLLFLCLRFALALARQPLLLCGLVCLLFHLRLRLALQPLAASRLQPLLLRFLLQRLGL
jgi:hypothetical protein